MAIDIQKLVNEPEVWCDQESFLPTFCELPKGPGAHAAHYIVDFERIYIHLCYEHLKELHEALAAAVKKEEW